MSITSGFFNSIDGDRLYNAHDMSMYFKGLISDGVYENVDGKLQVTAAGGMNVNVATGRAVIDCQWFNSDAIEVLTIDAPTINMNRIDVIALRLDMTESGRAISLIVKKGTDGTTNPPVPERIWTENIKELYLARVYVSKTATAITASNIMDQRGTSNCGYVTGLITQVDTAELFEQYQAACEAYYNEMTAEFNAYILQKQTEFNTWFEDLTQQLHVDTDIIKYQHTQVYTVPNISIPLSSIPLGVAEYESGDIVLLHIGGVLLIEGTEFTITGVGANAVVSFTQGLKDTGRGIPITAIVIKSVIGASVLTDTIDAINGEVI